MLLAAIFSLGTVGEATIAPTGVNDAADLLYLRYTAMPEGHVRNSYASLVNVAGAGVAVVFQPSKNSWPWGEWGPASPVAATIARELRSSFALLFGEVVAVS